jgi:hypothetical protein
VKSTLQQGHNLSSVLFVRNRKPLKVTRYVEMHRVMCVCIGESEREREIERKV